MSIPLKIIEKYGLSHHNIDSANSFYKYGIPFILTEAYVMRKKIMVKEKIRAGEENLDSVTFNIVLTGVRLYKPMYVNSSGISVPLTPVIAQCNSRSYSSNLEIDMRISMTLTNKDHSETTIVENLNNLVIAKIPVIKGSSLCHTSNKSYETLVETKEDPLCPGGYCIINGHRFAIETMENVMNNRIRVHNTSGHNRSLVQGDFISKPGDSYENSGMMVVTVLQNGGVVVEVRRDPLSRVNIPFYIMMRILGITNDREIFELCSGGSIETDIGKSYATVLEQAMKVKYVPGGNMSQYHNLNEMLGAIIDIIEPAKLESIRKANAHLPESQMNTLLMTKCMSVIDNYLLPHIGTKPQYRIQKAWYVGMLIRKTLARYKGHLPFTDRDSYDIKRLHAGGVCMAKAFKTLLNQAFVTPVMTRLASQFEHNGQRLQMATTVSGAVRPSEFEREFYSLIQAGSRPAGNARMGAVRSRISSQIMPYANGIATIAALRQVVAAGAETGAKQSARAVEMRLVHSSTVGYICMVSTPTGGEKVGINKQLALTAFITGLLPSALIKKALLSDPMILPLNTTTISQQTTAGRASVFCNGDWIGFTESVGELAKKYRNIRRTGDSLPHELTIVPDLLENEIHFHADIGRVIRPLLIVYNNKREHDIPMVEKITGKKVTGDEPFEQYIYVNDEIIDKICNGELSVDQLRTEGIIEWISADEQQTLLLCESYATLQLDNLNVHKQYTHCDIPQNILGIPALTSPLAHHNQSVRTIYQTSQVKQTCGVPVANWAHLFEKNGFIQYINSSPLVKTITNTLVQPPCGETVIAAIAAFHGSNQEDSSVLNRSAVDCGAFSGDKILTETVLLEPKQTIGKPSEAETSNMKLADYSNLDENGIIPVGSIVTNNTVLVSRYNIIQQKNNQTNSSILEKPRMDSSIVYKSHEPALIRAIHRGITDTNDKFVKIDIRKERPPTQGDKFSDRSGQKSVCALLANPVDLPFTRDGIIPTIVVNPHCIPARMTIGRLFESLLGILAAYRGYYIDGTMYQPQNIEEVGEILESYGFSKYGDFDVYDGMSGDLMAWRLFMGPVHYQRLQRFVLDKAYAVRHSPTDIMTGQPLNGKAVQGGLRLGEMERDVFVSHGTLNCFTEKFMKDSDGIMQYFCEHCGTPAIVNSGSENIYKCSSCGPMAKFVMYPNTVSCRLLRDEFLSLGLNIQMHKRPDVFEVEEIGRITEMRDEVLNHRNTNMRIEMISNNESPE